MNTQISIDAEIVPNESLGGLTIRAKLTDIQELITQRWVQEVSQKPAEQKEAAFQMQGPFVARYLLEDRAIEVFVDVRNGKIFQLTAKSGYQGTLFGVIRVGMSVSEAMTLEPRLYYDEGQELIMCKGVNGLAIDIPDTDPPPELVPTMNIFAISVYADEIDTIHGQDGDW